MIISNLRRYSNKQYNVEQTHKKSNAVCVEIKTIKTEKKRVIKNLITVLTCVSGEFSDTEYFIQIRE